MPLPTFYSCSRRLSAVFALCACAHAAAQTDATQTLERQSDDAFRQVLQQPQNLPLWSSYSQLLIRQGNYEGGIAALERLLLEPDPSPSLRVEIGVLYYRLASYAQAEAMLRRALEDNRLPDDHRALANALLADIAKRSQVSQLSGAFTFGLRHQSNPMYRTDSSQVIAGGVAVPNTLTPESNTDANFGVRLRHLYDLEKQNSAAIASTFGAAFTKYSSSAGSQVVANPTKPYDLLVLDLSTGLQFKPMPSDLPSLTIRPHFLWSNVLAQGKQYFDSYGLGLDTSWLVSERTLVDVTVDSQRRTFANRIDIPAADLLNGHLDSLRARWTHEVTAGQVVSADYVMRRNRTGRNFYDSDSHEVQLTYAVSYASPISAGGTWTTSVYAGALRRTFGGADPAVSATITRQDSESRLGITHRIPLTLDWSLSFALEEARNNANIANFNYKNTTLSGTVIRSF
jgi:Tfp pilus assembly protein PilF